ncbi:MAG: ABC transporter ATP-binding protein [Deltaproteobacteria bacterium]|nr:ABC transporter ATP-binding protein [Deltaproteobacteria bacterium]
MSETLPAPVKLHDLAKRFGEVWAVDGLSLEVASGEVVGLLGPNGAGKTTALRMLAGLITPSRGQALVADQDVTRHPLEARRRLGFLTASTGLYDRLTARELLTTFGRLHGLSRERLASRVDSLARDLDLAAFLDKRCGTLSSGQRQRVSIARALVHEPEVLVLDEPTAALDPLASRAILDLVREARKRGKAVLFSTHRMEEAEFLCDRLYFLRAGKAVAQGSPRELLAQSGQASLTGAFLHFAGEGRP